MGCVIKRREAIIRRLCGGSFYCIGLAFLGGEPCPCVPEKLTIKDIQVAHVAQNKNKHHKAYKEAELHPDRYIPLCVVCNYRMRNLKDELRKYPLEFRQEAALCASKEGGKAAAVKFNVDHNTVLRWRQEFGLDKYTGRKYTSCTKYRSHAFNASGKCSGCGLVKNAHVS